MNDGMNPHGPQDEAGAAGAAGGATHDEAFDRLAAADPAAGAELREGVLRAKVDDLRSDDVRAADAQDAAETATGVDDLAQRRAARRRRGAWLVAAGVAGAVAFGGGGYVLGGTTAGGLMGTAESSGSDSGGAAEPAITLGGPSAGDGGRSAMGGAEDSAGAAGAAESSAAARDIAYPGWYSGRALFTAEGLGTSTGEAEAFALDARDVTTEDAVRRLAEALGVAGEPKWSYGSWSVGGDDGTSKHLYVSVDGNAYFSYNDPAADPWRCQEPASDGSGDTEPAIEGCATPGTSTVSDREARKALSDLLARIGLDPDAYELEVQETSDDEPARWVTAYQVVGGSRTGMVFSATVADSGIAWVDGSLGTPTSIGTYPVVSETEAVERLGDPRFASSVYPIAFAESSRLEEPVADPGPGEPTPAPAPPSEGSKISWPVSNVTITEARLGLAQHQQEDGAVLLVPTYELRDAEGNAWSVIAVTEDALDFAG